MIIPTSKFSKYFILEILHTYPKEMTPPERSFIRITKFLICSINDAGTVSLFLISFLRHSKSNLKFFEMVS